MLKNVMSLTDAAGTVRANYAYAPFGDATLREGDKTQQNAYRFSSEYADEELGLIYYNYRHLNPLEGRWISRDPIAERGGWNVYVFIQNQINTKYDRFGQKFGKINIKEAENGFITRVNQLPRGEYGHVKHIPNYQTRPIEATFCCVVKFSGKPKLTISILNDEFLKLRSYEFVLQHKKKHAQAIREAWNNMIVIATT